MKNEVSQDSKIRRPSLPLPSSSALRGRQSVRATFKLTEKAIHAIHIVARHLGLNQKSVFDHLMGDRESLNRIASELQHTYLDFEELDRVQKTYVVSRNTLSFLEQVSKQFNTKRDALVEYSAQRLLPIIDQERQRQKIREEVLSELTEFLRQGEKILRKCRKTLTEEDSVYEKLERMLSMCHLAFNDIESFVKKCRVIEDFQS